MMDDSQKRFGLGEQKHVKAMIKDNCFIKEKNDDSSQNQLFSEVGRELITEKNNF